MPDSTSVRAWPFLIGRSKLRPIEVIVAPKPMVEAHVPGLLSDAATSSGIATSYGYACYREVWQANDNPLRLFTLLYHVIPATEYFIGNSSDSQILDRHGRPINLIEGLIIPHLPENMQWSELALASAHSIAMAAYHRFWHESDIDVIASEYMQVVFHETDIPLNLQKIESYTTKSTAVIGWPTAPSK